MRYITNTVAVSSRWRRRGLFWRPPPAAAVPQSIAAAGAARATPPTRSSLCYSRNVISLNNKWAFAKVSICVVIYRSRLNMKKQDSECSLGRGVRGQKPARLLTDSISSEEGQETERLLASQLPAAVVAAASGRRQSLTAPPSPTDSRKKHHHRHHNYMNQLQHLIHWRDIWGGEPHKGQEVPRLMIYNKCYNLCRLTSFLTFLSWDVSFCARYLCTYSSVLSDLTFHCCCEFIVYFISFQTISFLGPIWPWLMWIHLWKLLLYYIHTFSYLFNWYIFVTGCYSNFREMWAQYLQRRL